MTEHEEQVALMKVVEMHKGRWPDVQYANTGGSKVDGVLKKRLQQKSSCPSESEEQVALMRIVAMHESRLPELGMLFHTPNGGNRNVITAKKLKAEGVRRGVPDLCLPVPRGGYHGLFIELKRQKGGQVSAEQKAWISALRGQGYRAEVCKGATEAWDVIREYIQA